jgi:DNA repair protein RadA/Sms
MSKLGAARARTRTHARVSHAWRFASPATRTLQAMARSTFHVCSQCGSTSAQWRGQCPACEAWNTLVEERVPSGGGEGRGARSARLRVAPGDPGAHAAMPVPLREVASAPTERIATGLGELDRVLGGGIVPGSLILLGGSPGIGKSTLTNMVLGNVAAAGHRTLYVSGEESAEQVRLRAERLTQRIAPAPERASGAALADRTMPTEQAPCGYALDVPVLAETDLGVVLDSLLAHESAVCVIDSVQTLRCPELSGAPGSVGQVREVAAQIMEVAKARRIAVILVGHVTKEGALAGPRVLEHLVDCVLQFEGERERPYRELRALKNRFGSTSEAGLFEMRQDGLVEVLDASARFVANATCAPGSVVLAAIEGSRPLLVEVQALVSPSELEQPRRVVSGLDRNRLALVLAILGRHGGIGTGAADVFVNVVGGVRVDEPGVDLAIALAVASAARGVALRGARAIPAIPASGAEEAVAGEPSAKLARAQGRAPGLVVPCACFGELGLTGELRWVGHPERRLAEASRHGLDCVLAPPASGAGSREVATLREALAVSLPGRAVRRPARAAA